MPTNMLTAQPGVQHASYPLHRLVALWNVVTSHQMYQLQVEFACRWHRPIAHFLATSRAAWSTEQVKVMHLCSFLPCHDP